MSAILCSICQEAFGTQIDNIPMTTRCGHIYCRTCATRHFRGDLTPCAICRKPHGLNELIELYLTYDTSPTPHKDSRDDRRDRVRNGHLQVEEQFVRGLHAQIRSLQDERADYKECTKRLIQELIAECKSLQEELEARKETERDDKEIINTLRARVEITRRTINDRDDKVASLEVVIRKLRDDVDAYRSELVESNHTDGEGRRRIVEQPLRIPRVNDGHVHRIDLVPKSKFGSLASITSVFESWPSPKSLFKSSTTPRSGFTGRQPESRRNAVNLLGRGKSMSVISLRRKHRRGVWG